jgi:transposase
MPLRSQGPGCKPSQSLCPNFSCFLWRGLAILSADLWKCHLSEGTVGRLDCGSKGLEPSLLSLKQWLVASRVDHVDETGIRVKGLLRWMHVTSTTWLTLYSWHKKRGQEAIDAIGVLPQYQGRALHDRWHSYDHSPCAQSVCGAHLLRDCLFVAEQEKRAFRTGHV